MRNNRKKRKILITYQTHFLLAFVIQELKVNIRKAKLNGKNFDKGHVKC